MARRIETAAADPDNAVSPQNPSAAAFSTKGKTAALVMTEIAATSYSHSSQAAGCRSTIHPRSGTTASLARLTKSGTTACQP